MFLQEKNPRSRGPSWVGHAVLQITAWWLGPGDGGGGAGSAPGWKTELARLPNREAKLGRKDA